MSEQFSMDTLEKLDQFIDTNPEPREIKRALAVQMLAQSVKRTKIQEILGISEAFISKWKVRYAWEGLEGLKLKHQGSKGYLSKRDRAEVIHWLEQKTQVHFSDLKNHLEDCYGVEFKSKQSYYDLLKEAGMSWKKTQKKIPNEMIQGVKKRHEEICHLLESRREEIESGKLIVYLIDECHLLWGDVCGYGWGTTKERLEISMTNERDCRRQVASPHRATYYGALNYQTKEFFVKEYDKGNAKNTVLFLQSLRKLNQGKKLLIIWDGASYHRYKEMKEYLTEINQGLEISERPVHCEILAPNAPDQNPVEDIWLKAKKILRQFWYKLNSFALVKWLFEFFLQKEVFNFPKLHKYGTFSKEEEEMAVYGTQ